MSYLYGQHRADKVIAEINNGGDLVEANLRALHRNLPVRKIHAKRGKALRAEPVAALYERGPVSHVGTLATRRPAHGLGPATSTDSPDRLDALVVRADRAARERPRAARCLRRLRRPLLMLPTPAKTSHFAPVADGQKLGRDGLLAHERRQALYEDAPTGAPSFWEASVPLRERYPAVQSMLVRTAEPPHRAGVRRPAPSPR